VTVDKTIEASLSAISRGKKSVPAPILIVGRLPADNTVTAASFPAKRFRARVSQQQPADQRPASTGTPMLFSLSGSVPIGEIRG